MKFKPYQLPLLIILAGVVFSLYLQWLIPDGVYFSGDAGLKALLAKQLGAGTLRFDLVPPSETWVRDLWNQGLYPYEEPFVYHVSGRYYITFPFTFPLITAPFYRFFGYRGLYLIPLVSTWVIWLIVYFVCQRLKFNNLTTALTLIVLIFASPLTLYSSLYWEHTFAIALALAGLTILLFAKDSLGLSKRNAILSGFLIGLSVWFRPEFLCLIVILIGLVSMASLSSLSQWE
ncbi:MAG: LA_3751/LA_3752 family putative glycosyltransferase, partial [Microcystaceae cyanobacterium]